MIQATFDSVRITVNEIWVTIDKIVWIDDWTVAEVVAEPTVATSAARESFFQLTDSILVWLFSLKKDFSF
jgi:hypothetical protein